MIGKRSLNLILLISIVSLFSILTFISAQPYGGYGSGFGFIDLGEGIRQIIDQVIRFMTPLLEIVLGEYQGSEFFFAKVMVLILLVVVIYFILEKVPLFQGYRNISMLIALIISIIAVRFISDNDFINGILLPYGALGVTITTLIPFLVFSYGIHAAEIGSLGRRIGWSFFGLVFFIIWIYKFSELSAISNQIYLWSFLGIIVMFIFDKRIHYYFQSLEGKKAEKAIIDEKIAMLESRRDQIMTNAGASPSGEQRRTIDRYDREIRRLRAKAGFFR